jgi:hypothetical protein
MILIPIVDAAIPDTEPQKQVARLQFDESQKIQNINDGFSISTKEVTAPGNPNEIPNGSTIYHKNGITRVFDSNGKQISIFSDAKSKKLLLPRGILMQRMCIMFRMER